MMFNNLVRFVAAASAFTMAYSLALANGKFQIKSVSKGTFARNFNAGTPHVSTSIDFNPFASIDADNFAWHATKGAGDSGFTLTNVGSGNKAVLSDTTQFGFQVVFGIDNSSTQFAIEPTGDGNFTIQVPNAGEFWSVIEDEFFAFEIFIQPATGGDEQKFQLIPV